MRRAPASPLVPSWMRFARSAIRRLQVRIGIDSGQVLVRPTENDLAIDYDAVGATAHTANRLETMAEAGTAYVSATTFRLAQGAVEARSLGALAIRGTTRPLEVYQLLGAVEASRPLADPLHARMPCRRSPAASSK